MDASVRDRHAVPMPCRVLIVEDDEAFAEILMLLLDEDPSFAVVGHARDGVEAIDLAAFLRPDVIVMDIDMPRMDGVEATRRILTADPEQGIVIVSGSISRNRIEEARDTGAGGCVSKARAVDELRNVLVAVCRGRASVAAG